MKRYGIRNLVKWLLAKNGRVLGKLRLIVNDVGTENIDASRLAEDVDLIVVGGYQKRKINAFLIASRSFGPADKAYTDMVSVYESDFGVCKIIASRWLPQDAVLFLDSSRISVLPLAGRSFHFKPLASSGDYECGQLIGEYTLEFRNEAAHGLIRDLATS